jgi:hypothetical protein
MLVVLFYLFSGIIINDLKKDYTYSKLAVGFAGLGFGDLLMLSP